MCGGVVEVVGTGGRSADCREEECAWVLGVGELVVSRCLETTSIKEGFLAESFLNNTTLY